MMASGGGGSVGASILGEERRCFEGAPPGGSCLEGTPPQLPRNSTAAWGRGEEVVRHSKA